MKIFNQKSKIGLSVICTAAILLAILILTNFLVGLLPKNLTLLDTTENKMYSISKSAISEISAVEDDVNIYLLTTGGEDALNDTGIHLNAFLKRASSFNTKITYTLLDLYSNDNFLENRGIDPSSVTLNSIVVESKLRHRYIDSNELFYYYIDGIGKVNQNEAQLYQMYYGLTSTYNFGGEELLLNSLSYVTSTELPTAICLTGHGETLIGSKLKAEFTNARIAVSELETLALIPASEMLIMNNPTSDINAAEASILSQYLDKGGKLLLVTSPGTSGFSNLCSVLEDFGLGYEDGLIMDQTQGSYYQYPYYLVPTSHSNDYTANLSASPLLPFSHGINIFSVDGINSVKILSTSQTSYILPTTATSTSKPAGQEEKTYTVGVISENSANSSAIIWFSSQMFLDESVNSATGGGNFEYTTAISKYMCGTEESDTQSLTPLELTTETLTFSLSSMAIVAIIVVAIIPLTIVIIGIVYCQRRKKR